MKIMKEFIPLILSGEKKYEFRNEEGLEGFYEIDGIVLRLEYCASRGYNISKFTEFGFIRHHICDREITQQEYLWAVDNVEYFYEKEAHTHIVHIYKWEKAGDTNIKKLEAV